MSIAELSPLERAARLKKEADALLLDIELEKLTQAIGPLTPHWQLLSGYDDLPGYRSLPSSNHGEATI